MTLPLRRLIALTASVAAPVLGLACLLLGLPAPAQAANVVVHNCSQAGLHAAILAAGNSGVVTFGCTSGGPIITLASTEQISHDVTIDGGGVITISGGGSTRLFSVPGSQKATLANLGLIQGSASQGAAVNVNGFLVAQNDNFFHNAASTSGGAIEVNNLGTALVHASLFFSNTAGQGAAIHTSGLLEVDGSTFNDNTAVTGAAVDQDSGSASISQTLFLNNRAIFGGAINAQASLNLALDEFDHNHAAPIEAFLGQAGGGALYLLDHATTTLAQDVFFSNTAVLGPSDGLGGAIFNQGSVLASDSLFNQNHAQVDGGAVFNTGTLFQVEQSTFTRNSALGLGGAISNTGIVDIHTSTLVSNTAGTSGGAIANAGAVGLTSSQMEHNSAPSGGALRNQGAYVVVRQSTLYSNTALTGDGGAVLNNGALLVSASTFAANAAPNGNGAALQMSGSNAPVLALANVTIVSNTAASGGAALRRITGQTQLANDIIAFNQPDNCQGMLTHLGYSIQYQGIGLSCGTAITNTNPLLGPPQDNGGPRIGVLGAALLTLLPQTGSPAINASNPDNCAASPPVDERGFAYLGVCDIGAVERVFPVELPIVRR